MKEGRLALIRAETTDNGVKIFCQSEAIHNYFSKDADGKVIEQRFDKEGWNGSYFDNDYKPELDHFFQAGGGLFVSGKPNLSFFRSSSILEGREFEIEEMISRTQLKMWEGDVSEALTAFYRKYLDNDAFELVINVRRIPGKEVSK